MPVTETLDPQLGLLDLAGPLFATIDALFGFLPPVLRLFLWAAIAGGASMALYKALSPQPQIAQAKAAAREARRALDAHDGTIAEAWPLIGRAVATAVRPFRLELPPALLASLPVLFLIVWISAAYGYRFPATDRAMAARVTPPQFSAWLMRERPVPATRLAAYRLRILDPAGHAADLPLREPVPTLAKKQWWNLFAGNPAGYLAETGPVERVDLPVVAQEFLSIGPSWARGWELPFFGGLILSSLLAKRLWGIA